MWYCPDCGKGGPNVRGPATHYCPAVDAVVRPEVPSGDPPSDEGVGTEIERVLSWCGIGSVSGCACKSLKHQLNKWPLEKCRRRRGDIVRALVQEAKRRRWVGYPILWLGAWAVVALAIRRASRRAFAQ